MRVFAAFPRYFSERHCQPEMMDDPGLDQAEHRRALRALGRVNRLSRSAAITWSGIRPFARDRAESRPLRVLDLACGGGDVVCELTRLAARTSHPLLVDGCDASPVAVDHATRQARSAKNAASRFFSLDVLKDDLPAGYDVLTCSLFLHHLSREDGKQLLARMAAVSPLVLVNDLRRTRRGYVLAWLGCRLLSRSPVVHHDGPLSVRAAYTIPEARQLAQDAGLKGAVVSPRWPERFLLSWRKAP